MNRSMNGLFLPMMKSFPKRNLVVSNNVFVPTNMYSSMALKSLRGKQSIPFMSILNHPASTKFLPLFLHRNLNSWRRKTPYEVLGVSKTATTKEIKLAYFRLAKQFHPDLNPNDPSAKAKFQEVSAAYELLSDETKRRMYDSTGFSSDTHHHSNQQQHAEEVFYTVQQDVDVVREAVGLYAEEMKDEMNYAIDCISRRDWTGLGEVLKAHSILVASVVVPTVLFLRYPPAVFAVMRVLFAAGQLVAAGLVYTGNVEVAVKMVWKAIVKVSLEQKRRSEEKRKA